MEHDTATIISLIFSKLIHPQHSLFCLLFCDQWMRWAMGRCVGEWKRAWVMGIITLIMKTLKDEVKTWNSQQSDVDAFSRQQNCFLEKFVKYLLADQLEPTLTNIYEAHFRKDLPDRSSRTLAQDLFLINAPLPLATLTHKLRSYLLSRSPSFSSGELTALLEPKYFNRAGEQCTMRKGELMLVSVSIRADIQRIQELAVRMRGLLESGAQRGKDCPLVRLLENYKEEYINFVVFYYGEYNFGLVRLQHYRQTELVLLGKTYKLRIMVVFVSKVGLMETFRSINRVPHLEYINDLIIQFYELRREKGKKKKAKRVAAAAPSPPKCQSFLKTAVGLAMLGVGMAVVLRKMLS